MATTSTDSLREGWGAAKQGLRFAVNCLRQDVGVEDESQLSNARGRFSRGSTDTLLNEDLAILFRGGSPDDLLEPMRRIFGRLDVEPNDLAGRPARRREGGDVGHLAPPIRQIDKSAGPGEWH